VIGLVIVWLNPPIITLALDIDWVAILGFAGAITGIIFL
jgi:hypothetical protein